MTFESKFGFESEHPPLNSEWLDQLTTSLGEPLPEDYVSFLTQWNGGQFSNCVLFPMLSGPHPDDDEFDPEFDVGYLEELYGLYNPSSILDLRNSNKGYGFEQAVPPGFLSIGGWSSFERVCMSLRRHDHGQIFWWSPGEPWVEEKTEEFLNPVARSFADFWKCLFTMEGFP